MLTSGVFGYLSDYLIWWALFASLLVHTWCFFRYFPASRRRVRLVLGNALIFLCLVGAAAMAGETYFRFVAVETDSFGMSLPARRWFALHTTLNSLGCRDNEWPRSKASGVRRIAFLGDSFVYGWGIENPGDRFSDIVQAKFDNRFPGSVEILNVAKPGWGTGDQIAPLADMIDVFEVDEVVLCHVPNDIEKLLPRDPEFDPIRPPTPSLFNLESSPLLDFLYRRVYLPRVPTVSGYHDWLAAGYSDPEVWSRQRERYEEIIRLCENKKVALRVVLLPFLRTQGTGFDPARIQERVGSAFGSHQIATVDLLPSVVSRESSDLVVSAADAHPNETAHRLFAEEIVRAFWPELNTARQ